MVEREVLKVVAVVQGSIAFILNGGLIAYFIGKRLYERRITNLILMNMFLAHLVENVVTILYGSAFVLDVNSSQTMKRNVINLSTCMAFLSSFCNLPLTCERLIAIKWPFIYQRIQPIHVYVTCLFMWLPPTIYYVCALILQLNTYYGDLLNATIILATMVLLAIANGLIYDVVRKQKRQIANLQVHSLPTTSEMTSGTDKPLELTQKDKTEEAASSVKAKAKNEKRNIKASYICIGLVLDYIIFWFPTCFFDLLKISNLATDVVYTGAFIVMFFVRFALLNSLFDPIIYILMNRDIRAEIKKTIKKILKC